MSSTLKVLSLIGKVLGIITSFNAIPFVPQETGVVIFMIASSLKDTVNRVGDILDDGKQNNSFK